MISLFISLFAFYEVGLSSSPCYIKLLTWFNSEYLCADWGFQFDSLTVVMLIVVTFISNGEIDISLALDKFLIVFFDENLFIKKP